MKVKKDRRKEGKNKRGGKKEGKELFPRAAGSSADDTFVRQTENSELRARTARNFAFRTPHNYLAWNHPPEDSLVGSKLCLELEKLLPSKAISKLVLPDFNSK